MKRALIALLLAGCGAPAPREPQGLFKFVRTVEVTPPIFQGGGFARINYVPATSTRWTRSGRGRT